MHLDNVSISNVQCTSVPYKIIKKYHTFSKEICYQPEYKFVKRKRTNPIEIRTPLVFRIAQKFKKLTP